MKPFIKCKHILLLSAVLLSVQLSSLWHSAEHDFTSHDHNGAACEYLHYLKASSDALISCASTDLPALSQFQHLRWLTRDALPNRIPSYNGARAPPFIA